MKSSLLGMGLIFAAAVSGVALSTFIPPLKAATAQFGKPTYALVMTVQRGQSYDDYIMDHDMSIGDCYSALRPTYLDTVQGTTVSVSFACEIR